MATITLKGNPVETSGELPAPGSRSPAFSLVAADLSELTLADYAGKRVVLNIFPSIDTGVCAASVRRFNQAAAALDNTVVLCVSADLPFASKRFCAAEGISGVVTGSSFRSRAFGRDYGVEMVSGPLAGLLARAVVVVGTDGTILHGQLVGEIAEEPDYDAALGVL